MNAVRTAERRSWTLNSQPLETVSGLRMDQRFIARKSGSLRRYTVFPLKESRISRDYCRFPADIIGHWLSNDLIIPGYHPESEVCRKNLEILERYVGIVRSIPTLIFAFPPTNGRSARVCVQAAVDGRG
jgi:hypothetical protein